MRRLTLRSSGLPSVSLNLNVSQTIAKECHVTAVAESRLKGNYGAATVMARLSAECLVRPVAVDTDIGRRLVLRDGSRGPSIPSLLAPGQGRRSVQGWARFRQSVVFF
jgi:hypothetical protein